jgi:multisubunit Na+/H+ antiporter MnhB subunit
MEIKKTDKLMNDPANTGMSFIVKSTARFISVFILIFGISVIIRGHSGPGGGGFAGGIIISLALVNLMIAFGKYKAVSMISKNISFHLEALGAALFFIIIILGFFGRHMFLGYISVWIKTALGMLALLIAFVALDRLKRRQ